MNILRTPVTIWLQIGHSDRWISLFMLNSPKPFLAHTSFWKASQLRLFQVASRLKPYETLLHFGAVRAKLAMIGCLRLLNSNVVKMPPFKPPRSTCNISCCLIWFYSIVDYSLRSVRPNLSLCTMGNRPSCHLIFYLTYEILVKD